MQQDELRAGDLQSRSLSGSPSTEPSGRTRIDPAQFPVLAAWLQLPSGPFQERLDELATRARQATAPGLQQAYQLAIRMLQSFHRKMQGGAQ